MTNNIDEYTTYYNQVNNIANQYIDCIIDANIKNFLNWVFQQDIVKFYLEQSSSSSLKYHPTDEHYYCGQFIHTLKATHLAILFYRSYPFKTRENLDVIIAGTLLHDIPYKYTFNNGILHYEKDHDVKNALWFEQNCKAFNILEEKANKIRDCILFHNGSFCQTNSTYFNGKKQDEITFITHIGDYLSSRSSVSVDWTNTQYIYQLLEDFENDA